MSISCVNMLTGSATNGGDVTITFSGGIEENDVVLVVGGHGVTTTTITGPTGYTAIATHDTTAPIGGAWYKVMGATPDSSVTCSGGGNVNDGVAYVAYVFRGVDPDNVLDVAATTATASGAAPDAPSITPSTVGSWIVAAGMNDANDTGVTEPTGYYFPTRANGNDVADYTVAGAINPYWTSGAEDPGGWSLWATGECFSVTIALRPLSAVAFRGSLLRGNTG